MIVSIHQPAYFPWLGLLEKIALSDRFVLLDTVQFNARAFQHRTLYSTAAGTKYLTLPVHSRGVQIEGTAIREIELADARAPRKHYKTLVQRYGKRPGWPRVAARIEALLHEPRTRLVDIDIATLRLTLECFEIATEIVLASSLRAEGRKSALMLALARAAGGDAYLSGMGARDYLEPGAFAREGVALAYQDFHHPRYRQSQAGEFQPGCLALEWFFEEPDAAVSGFRAQVAAARARLGLH